MPKLPEQIIIPSAVDIHVHLREPGTNKAETIESGSLAALLRGFALICDMSNNPGRPTWTLRRTKDKHDRIWRTSYIPIATYAGSQPESNNERELPKMALLSIGLKSYLGETTGNDREYKASDFKDIWRLWNQLAPEKPIMIHRGSADLEEIISFTAAELGHRTHICHTNHPDEVEIVQRVKREGLPVTIGICPHHIFKTSHDVLTEGSFAQMQPPLAHQIDTEKLMYLLAMGEIDIVESEHAPHQG
ncbi:amidohydrolase family protein [Candidatus Saccharibacteria bacterium]|nr:amidohydrolase family protein [Candidatus Saccharibacteria bacterium]